jgi:hypothetical protein
LWHLSLKDHREEIEMWAFIIDFFSFDNPYAATQTVLCLLLIVSSALFLIISYWFEALHIYKEKHGFVEEDKNKLSGIVEAKVIEKCNLQDEDYKNIVKAACKVALDD